MRQEAIRDDIAANLDAVDIATRPASHKALAGLAAGVGLALLLGWALLTVQDELTGEALEIFQTVTLFVAAGLITGADIKNDSVTGKDVKESSLAKVKAATNADPGFFGKLFSSSGNAAAPLKFRISVKSQGEATTVSVLNASGAPETSANAQRIIKVMALKQLQGI